MEKIILHSSMVYLSEENTNPDQYIAKFILCDFGRNKNNVALDRNTIETWMSTLINNPLVGKIKMKYDGTYDFTGHNVKIVNQVDENGTEYQEIEFDTDAFGNFTNIAIETIDDKEYLVATCIIWKRFTRACNLIISRIKNGILNTSWEIAIEKERQGIVDGLMTRIIEVGRFIGHCLLGTQVAPAYDSSHLLEIASENSNDLEFAQALSQDILNNCFNIINTKKEENNLLNKTLNNVTTSSNNTTTPITPEISALTTGDLRMKVMLACRSKINKWCWIAYMFPEEHEVWCEYDDADTELDYLKFTYTVGENDTVTVSEPIKVKLTVSPKNINTVVSEYEATIAEKDTLILKASEELTLLKTQITELSQYKEKFEQAEQNRINEEIKQKKKDLIASVVKSGQITQEELESSEELKGYINTLDKKSLMAIIGERLTSSITKEQTNNSIITSQIQGTQIHVATNLNTTDHEITSEQEKASTVRRFLNIRN